MTDNNYHLKIASTDHNYNLDAKQIHEKIASIAKQVKANPTYTMKNEDYEVDLVNSPAHYCILEGKEVIDVIREVLGGKSSEEFISYCQGNVIKYVLRSKYKGKRLEDLKKAEYYLQRMIEGLEG